MSMKPSDRNADNTVVKARWYHEWSRCKAVHPLGWVCGACRHGLLYADTHACPNCNAEIQFRDMEPERIDAGPGDGVDWQGDAAGRIAKFLAEDLSIPSQAVFRSLIQAAYIERLGQTTRRQIAVVEEILGELRRQNAEHGEHNNPREWWLAILVEEVGRLAGVITASATEGWTEVARRDRLWTQMLEVATIATAWLEAHLRESEGAR